MTRAQRHRPALLVSILFFAFATWAATQEAAHDNQDNAAIRQVVDMVQLNVAVTDSRGNYITGLHASDFTINEDRITQNIATFDEGNEGWQTVPARSADPAKAAVSAAVSSTSIFILFDTSNYIYQRRGFVFAQDSIVNFVRSLDNYGRVAFYSYSRDLSRESLLAADRSLVLRGVRSTVNGDDSALYNALLLTLKDAAQYTGRRVVVVFSNGPDNASMVPPEDVAELAESEGVPIYMVSTREAQLDPTSATVFRRMTANTGGQAYFTKNWQEQQNAFSSIREDLAHLYLLSYYPQPNPNRGWRTITVKLVGPHLQKYRIRTREGYRPLPTRVSVDSTPVRIE